MERVGVEMVVEGLSSFLGDMGKADKGIQSLIPTTGLLGSAFSALGDIANSVGNFITNVLAHALGELLADAVQWVTAKIQELISSTFALADELARLEIRLNGLNLPASTADIKNWDDALQEASAATQEQLSWLQALAVAAPFEPSKIADIYTAARAMGYADDAARALTVDILEFSAGMGLTNEQAERIIINFRQMETRGKITTREMNDLARGALVPLDDVLQRVVDSLNEQGISFKDNSDEIAKYVEKIDLLKGRLAIAIQKQSEFTDATKESTRMANALTIKNLEAEILAASGAMDGLSQSSSNYKMTVAELQAEISKPGGGISADLFIKAFQEMVDEEPRFVGAMGRLGRTLEMATKNFMEFLSSLGAKNILLPIFKVLGERIATITDQFVQFEEGTGSLIKTEKWDAAVAAAGRVGAAIADVVSQLLGLAPSAEGIADGIVNGLNGIADWMDANKQNITGAISTFFQWLKDTVYPFITTILIPKIGELWNWLFGQGMEQGAVSIVLQKIYDIGVALAPVLAPLVNLLGALGEVIIIAFGGTETQTFGEFVRDTLVPAMTNLATWIRSNKEAIAEWLVFLVKLSILIDIAVWIGGLIAAVITGFASVILTVALTVSAILTAAALIASLPVAISVAVAVMIGAILGGLVGLGIAIVAWVADKIGLFDGLKNSIVSIFSTIGNAMWGAISNIENTIMSMDWSNIGWAIASGIADGIGGAAWRIADAAYDAARGAYEAAMNAINANSPSKLFEQLGGFTMEGMAIGIEKSAGMAVSAMASAVGKMTMPALSAPSMAYSAASSAPSGNTYSTSNEFNMNINTSANSEPIIADFDMMQSLAGI
jgi:hypothetical protein